MYGGEGGIRTLDVSLFINWLKVSVRLLLGFGYFNKGILTPYGLAGLPPMIYF